MFMVDMAHFAGLVATRHASVAGSARRRRHDDHAQDAARPARRPDSLQGGAREGDRQGGVPGHAGRPARARDRRQGGRVQGSARTRRSRSTAAQIVANAQALAAALVERGFQIVSGGTDNHLMLVDLRNKGLTGQGGEKALDRAGITVNKNTVPKETQSPFVTSGVRIGTPAVTTRGMGEAEMAEIAVLIDRVAAAPEDASVTSAVRDEVRALTSRFPLYPGAFVRARSLRVAELAFRDGVMDRIRLREPRYDEGAYLFVLAALEYAQSQP